ncbi:hypothetical protein SAMN00120144_3512 [Hymenobacter roseosalivarius DSM 11622]|uniref:Uncharacterized protein n=1 Tax=Hymenobacter roseosalivarius DSM 11622 TaxID=645990 RepID=A0A1W1VYU0_9BACT|nr:hypothetical protein SAMN00120144_3512 [Hymenobacter roseosalivarius DSM 11622]
MVFDRHFRFLFQRLNLYASLIYGQSQDLIQANTITY